MELFLLRLKKAFAKLFGLSFLAGFLVVLFMFSGVIFLNFQRIGAFCYVYVGDKFAQKHEYQDAIDYYNRALTLYPGHVKARYNLGNIFVAYEDYDSAMDCYNKALLYDPNYINARINLGIILAEEKLDLDAGINEYLKATQVQTPFIRIPFIYDNAKMIKNARAKAFYDMGLAYRDKSLLFEPNTVDSNNYLQQSIECYKSSIDLDPKNYDARYNLALTYHLLKLYPDALGGYCKAMLIAPLNYEAYYNLAVLLRQKGQYAQAADEFRTAGSLINLEGDTFKAAFIYQVLNEVSSMAIAQHGFESKKVMERLDTDLSKESEKIIEPDARDITVDELQKILVKRIKTCSICKSYLEGE